MNYSWPTGNSDDNDKYSGIATSRSFISFRDSESIVNMVDA